MIVLIGGMPRSGSTFSFNVVRELLNLRGTVYQESLPNILPVVERAGNADHVLLKAHSADETTTRLVRLGAIKAVCTIRKPEDAIASWMETFGFTLEQSIEYMRGWFMSFEHIRHHALVVRYELIDRHPSWAAWSIARYILPNPSRIEVVGIAARYSKDDVLKMSNDLQKGAPGVCDIGFSYYDTTTFIHRRHVSALVSSPAVARIGEDAVKHIRQGLGAYVDQNGNIQNLKFWLRRRTPATRLSDRSECTANPSSSS